MTKKSQVVNCRTYGFKATNGTVGGENPVREDRRRVDYAGSLVRSLWRTADGESIQKAKSS